MKDLKKGYYVEVTSWENDGDYYNTKFKLERPEWIPLVIDLMKLFETSHHEGGLGNFYDGYGATPFEELEEVFYVFYKKHKTLVEPDTKDWERDSKGKLLRSDIMEYFEEIAREYLGHSESYRYRMVESVKVYHIPEDMIFTDVTTQFKKTKKINKERI